MGDLVDSAARILSQTERRIELSAQNIANLSTPGYKRRTSFDTVMAGVATSAPAMTSTDFSNGKPIQTGVGTDLAIAGDGFFVVRSEQQQFYTRQGQFRREADGRLVTPQGFALQAAGGGDIVVASPDFRVLQDGVVLEHDRPTAKIAVVDFADRTGLRSADAGGVYATESSPVDIQTPVVRQGELEASNVSTGDEMVAIMAALRRAESAQRLVNVYDDLMGRALTTFGQN